jgi:hypothetical protein
MEGCLLPGVVGIPERDDAPPAAPTPLAGSDGEEELRRRLTALGYLEEAAW